VSTSPTLDRFDFCEKVRAVVRSRDTTWLVPQHRLDSSSPAVGEVIAHDSTLSGLALESRAYGSSQRSLQLPQKVRFRGEAEVRWDAKPPDSVENDPERSFAIRIAGTWSIAGGAEATRLAFIGATFPVQCIRSCVSNKDVVRF
jgi:hypothetical protein